MSASPDTWKGDNEMNAISEIVTKRLARGEAQRIHIPWPAHDLGAYGANQSTAADMDRWVSEHVGLPANTSIIGTCAGRAYRGNDLLPCLIVTAARAGAGELPLRIRNTWSDGRGGVR
jgi:hypothetical protein